MASALGKINVDVVVAAGSTDGMAGAAACYRNNPNLQLVVTQAFQVNTIDISKWPLNSKVGFIDLAVNNDARSQGPQLTIDFVKKIYDAGHVILFIADEHDKKAWHHVLEECGHAKSELTIKPKTREQERYTSSCALLKTALGDSADAHMQELLNAGDQADQMNFETHLGTIFNDCTKSDIRDNNRRIYAVEHMALNSNPDEKIQGWLNEYAPIKDHQPTILASRQGLDDGISLYDCTTGPYDATALFIEAYKRNSTDKGSVVVLSGVKIVLNGEEKLGACIATDREDLNILQIMEDVGIEAGGMATRVNVAMKDQDNAIEAIGQVIRSTV